MLWNVESEILADVFGEPPVGLTTDEERAWFAKRDDEFVADEQKGTARF